MNTLYDRRTIAQIIFIFQLKDKIKSPPLLNKIGFGVYERNLRNHELLTIDYNYNDPYNVMRQKFNEYSSLIDLSRSFDTQKNYLKEFFK